MKRKKGKFQRETKVSRFWTILIPTAVLMAVVISGVLILQHRGTSLEKEYVVSEDSVAVSQPAATLSRDKYESTNQSPVEKYLHDVILPQYNTELSKIETTYYCQTYGGMAGGAYATITLDNFYDFTNIEPWLLAYNIADYDADGIEDLFLITLDISGEGKIGQLNITRRIFIFDNNGDSECKCWHTTKVSASERKRVFAFAGNKLLEICSYDTSEHSEGDNESTIVYPVTDNKYSHTDALDVRSFNQETNDLDFSFSFTRRINTSGYSSCSIDYEDCESEQAGIAACQSFLSENNILGVVIPQSSTWDDRWKNVMVLQNGTDYPSFGFDSSPTVSRECHDVGELSRQYDGKIALNTTTGTMTFQRY